MWDDITIGVGPKFCSATKLNDYNFSQNSVSYWIHGDDNELGVGLAILKYTEEGQQLGALIEKKADKKEVDNFILGVICRNLTPELLAKKIAYIKERAFYEGKRKKTQEIREVLGI